MAYGKSLRSQPFVEMLLIVAIVCSVHGARGSTVILAWSDTSVGLQARRSDPNGIGRTGLRDDGFTSAVGRQGLTGFARVWLQVLERLPDVFPSHAENSFPVSCLERCLERCPERLTDLYPSRVFERPTESRLISSREVLSSVVSWFVCSFVRFRLWQYGDHYFDMHIVR